MDVRETPLTEIESAGYHVLELEMRNLSLASTQVQGVSFTSADCGAMSLDRFPIRIDPLGVKRIRIMAVRNSRSTGDVFKVSRDGRPEFVSLPAKEKSL